MMSTQPEGYDAVLDGSDRANNCHDISQCGAPKPMQHGWQNKLLFKYVSVGPEIVLSALYQHTPAKPQLLYLQAS